MYGDDYITFGDTHLKTCYYYGGEVVIIKNVLLFVWEGAALIEVIPKLVPCVNSEMPTEIPKPVPCVS